MTKVSRINSIAAIILASLAASCNYVSPIMPWEDGVIPYYLTGEYSNDEIDAISQAMQSWEESCGVWFQMVTPRTYAYEIIKTLNSNTWASSIGENNVYNHMYFGTGGGELGHVRHELGHCLGLIHEHQRPDRDQYVDIVWEKIFPEYAHNFEKDDNPLITEQDYPYDYRSIMHYHSTGFSIDGSETIVPLDPDIEIERTDELTDDDRKKCREIYGDPIEDREEPPPY